VRNVRVDGKVHTEHIAYLGSIADEGRTEPKAVSEFWAKVDGTLWTMEVFSKTITHEQREKVEAAVGAVVPRMKPKSAHWDKPIDRPS
jgi:hypothetical protein